MDFLSSIGLGEAPPAGNYVMMPGPGAAQPWQMPTFDPFYLIHPAGSLEQINPATPKPGDTQVKVSAASQIKDISNALFGAAGSGAKTFFEVKAMQQASNGLPLNINQAALQHSGMSSGQILGLGIGGLLLVGALFWYMTKKK